jgi:transcriptional regulator with PAS, ATPase and Fis domain
MLDAESLAIMGSVAGIISSCGIFMWKKLVNPAIKFLKDQEEIKQSIKTIKSEVITNGGSSIKDAINCLTVTCESIEKSQKVLDQRSKASLHYHDRALFEVDKFGRMSWFNEKFELLSELNGDSNEGFDWVNIVNESEREDFVKETTSCIEMCRKIDIVTNSVNNEKVHFLGYPYRITEKEHEGFLIHLYKEND